MYKDKDKQREADRERQRRYRTKRDKHGVTKGVTNRRKGVTNQGVTPGVTIDDLANGFCEAAKPKRGKDIKCFLDLPLDVQQTIERLCPDVVKDYEERRTAIAINYQHQFPGRFEPTDAVCTGVVTGKPGDVDYELEHAGQPKRKCKYCGKQLNHSVLVCCYECAIKRNSPGLSRTSSTTGASL